MIVREHIQVNHYGLILSSVQTTDFSGFVDVAGRLRPLTNTTKIFIIALYVSIGIFYQCFALSLQSIKLVDITDCQNAWPNSILDTQTNSCQSCDVFPSSSNSNRQQLRTEAAKVSNDTWAKALM